MRRAESFQERRSRGEAGDDTLDWGQGVLARTEPSRTDPIHAQGPSATSSQVPGLTEGSSPRWDLCQIPTTGPCVVCLPSHPGGPLCTATPSDLHCLAAISPSEDSARGFSSQELAVRECSGALDSGQTLLCMKGLLC